MCFILIFLKILEFRKIFFLNSDADSLCDGLEEKIFICRGSYRLDCPISLDKTRKIIAEPGTEIVMATNSCQSSKKNLELAAIFLIVQDF